MSDSEGASLLDDLSKVGADLAPSELPPAASALHVLGALIKVLDADGTKAADELVNPPAPAFGAGAGQPARPPETGQSQPDPGRLDRIEQALVKLLSRDDEKEAQAPADPPASGAAS